MLRKRTNIKLVLIVLLILQTSGFGQAFTDRLKTPIFFNASLSMGYDENILKFSEREKTDASFNPQLLGNTETFDSAILRPEIRLTYSPVFHTDHATNFSFGIAHSSYQQLGEKSYSSYVLKFEQHLSEYSWLEYHIPG